MPTAEKEVHCKRMWKLATKILDSCCTNGSCCSTRLTRKSATKYSLYNLNNVVKWYKPEMEINSVSGYLIFCVTETKRLYYYLEKVLY